jgi:hypothetical protein
VTVLFLKLAFKLAGVADLTGINTGVNTKIK